MERKNKSWTNFKRLFLNVWTFGKLSYKEMPLATSIIILMAILAGVFPVVLSKVFGYLIDSITTFIKSGQINNVWQILALYIATRTALPLVDTYASYNFKYWFINFTNFLDLYTIRKRGEADIAHIEDPSYQDLTQRAFNNGTSPIINIMDIGQQNIQRFVLFIGSAFAILFIDWRIFTITLISSIPNFIVEVYYGGGSWGLFAENSREQRRHLDNRTFFTNKFRVIEAKLFQIHDFFLASSKDIMDRFLGKQMQLEKRRFAYRFLTEILANAGIYLSLAIAIKMTLTGAITIGTVVFLFTAITNLNGAFSAFLLMLARQLERNLYVNDIVDLLATKPVIKTPSKPKRLSAKEKTVIEFKNVSFKYPKQDSLVLNNISFEINPGEKIAFVGHNGAGKSTIVRLLLRIHDATEGEILINGINIKELDLSQWWSRLGVLMQDYGGFQFLAKEAIAIADNTKKLDIDKVRLATKQSTAANYIDQWKDGLDTMIGVEFGGEELSKGEKQKMALARIFYRDADIYVLDEPTAAVDAPSASEIFRNIENLSEEKSALLISHNFATIRRANKILVMEHGKIVEEGTHEELTAKQGLYNSLYNQQKSEYE
ncbi:MAG: ABC transporter ATP-binding protein [bacterium]